MLPAVAPSALVLALILPVFTTVLATNDTLPPFSTSAEAEILPVLRTTERIN